MEAAGREVDVLWSGRRVRAFVPAELSERDLSLDVTSAARCASASAELGHAAEVLTGDFEALARLLLRAEGVASSFIEGVRAPLLEVVLAEMVPSALATSAGWIEANTRSLSLAIAAAHERRLDVDELCAWHRSLMENSPLPERYAGVLRDEQGWIGGTSPLDAHLVTPPPELVGDLLEDLVAYAVRDDLDALAQAAVVHAQFEIIHPFADGNGRIGRLLVAWVLTRRLALIVPPPLSSAIAADVGGYAAGLVLFRLGETSRWISWFADAVAAGARRQRELARQVEDVVRDWRETLNQRGALRSDATAHSVLDLLVRRLVLSSSRVMDDLGVSRKSALASLRRLEEMGVLERVTSVPRTGVGKPAEIYVASALLGLIGPGNSR